MAYSSYVAVMRPRRTCNSWLTSKQVALGIHGCRILARDASFMPELPSGAVLPPRPPPSCFSYPTTGNTAFGVAMTSAALASKQPFN